MPAKPLRRRDPAKEKHWRRIIRRQQTSGLSVHAFCEREGLKDGNFLWWRRELNRRDREKTSQPQLRCSALNSKALTPKSYDRTWLIGQVRSAQVNVLELI